MFLIAVAVLLPAFSPMLLYKLTGSPYSALMFIVSIPATWATIEYFIEYFDKTEKEK